jgi:predicted kinase
MTHPTLILIHGEAAIGKTALAARLARDLDLPTISKDDFSEMMYDKIGTKFNAPSSLSGHGVFSVISLRALGVVAEEFVESNQSVIIEAPFHEDLLRPYLQSVATTNAKILQIFCHTDQTTRQQRYDERLKSGQRHPGHGDRIDHQVRPPSHPPLPIDDTIDVDLTVFGDAEYVKLLGQVKKVVS